MDDLAAGAGATARAAPRPRPARHLQRALYATGTYEPAVLEFLHDELRHGDVVLDPGVHIGVHTLTAAAGLHQLAGPPRDPAPDHGAVIAFEPARDAAATPRWAPPSSVPTPPTSPPTQVLPVDNEVYRPLDRG